MKIEPLAIPEVMLIEPPRFEDARGYLSVTFDKAALAAQGIALDVAQDNQSFSKQVGTVRGLHFQTPPHTQSKLLRVLQGRVYDVAVDIRRGSPTFGRYVGAELDAERGRQIWIPAGFAHGFMTLDPDTIVHYKIGAPYAPSHEAGLAWNDPAIGIDWPLPEKRAILSDRDTTWPSLGDYASPFEYETVSA